MGVIAGIDVGARRVHVAVLDEELTLLRTAVMDSDDIDAVASYLADAETVAIDAPNAPSRGARPEHTGVGAKFLTGRCAEVALGQQFGIWVPWVTPCEPPFPPWMSVGFAIFEALGPDRTIEVYPHAIFRRLAGSGQLSKKSISAGARQRIDLLSARGIRLEHLQMWSHDALDAMAAALVAYDYRRGSAVPASCGHDGSAIWLPGGAPS